MTPTAAYTFLNKLVSLYPSHTSKVPAPTPAAQILAKIDQFPTTELTNARQSGKGSEPYELLKKSSIFICWNTSFGQGEAKSIGAGYLTNICYVDVDTAPTAEQLASIRQLPYVLATWISWGGIGLGVLCAIDIQPKDYDTFPLVYGQISADFAEFDVVTDAACANHNRGNYMSTDPEIWIRDVSEIITPVKAPELEINAPVRGGMGSGAGYITDYNSSSAGLKNSENLLTMAGWRLSGRTHWTRPGKAKGTSAVLSNSGKWANKFHNFSDNANLKSGHYSFFDLLCELQFSGDVEAAKAFIRPAAAAPKTPTAAKLAMSGQGGRPALEATEQQDLIDAILDTLPSEAGINGLVFPEDAMPLWLQEAANTYKAAAKEYIYPAMLAVAGAATANKLLIRILDNWVERPALWLTCLGYPGDGKSHPVNLLIKPLANIETELSNRFLEEKDKFVAAQSYADGLSKTEREMLVSGGNEAKPPVERAIYATTGTVEAIFKYMARNHNYLIIHADEMSGFFNQLGAYKNGKGSDKESVLSMWSGGRVVRILATQDKTSIENSFMPLIGTSQYSVIGPIMSKIGLESGLFDRMLWTAPRETQYVAKDFANEGKAMEWITDWNISINAIFAEYENRTDERILSIPRNAENVKILNDWEIEKAAQANLYKESGEIGKLQVNGKIDIYLYRFAAIMWLLDADQARFDGREAISLEVTPEQLRRAVKIANYFKLSAYAMLAKFSKEDVPHEMSPRELQQYQRKIALLAYNSKAMPDDIRKNGYASVVAEVVNAKIGKIGTVSGATVRGWKNRGWK